MVEDILYNNVPLAMLIDKIALHTNNEQELYVSLDNYNKYNSFTKPILIDKEAGTQETLDCFDASDIEKIGQQVASQQESCEKSSSNEKEILLKTTIKKRL
jgi:hypothetical protein